MTNRKSSVVLFSGGLDSTVLLYELLETNHKVLTLGVDYGQRHRVELERAQLLARHRDVEHRHLDLTWFGRLAAPSVLTARDKELPSASAPQGATVVPGRNAVLLSIAAAWAQARGFDSVAIAANATDHATYPDCRPAFLRSMSVVVALASDDRVRIIAPFVDLPKSAIVRHGQALGVPFAQTWSCYRGGTLHCGNCGACAARQTAFREARVDDPTEYEGETCAG